MKLRLLNQLHQFFLKQYKENPDLWQNFRVIDKDFQVKFLQFLLVQKLKQAQFQHYKYKQPHVM